MVLHGVACAHWEALCYAGSILRGDLLPSVHGPDDEPTAKVKFKCAPAGHVVEPACQVPHDSFRLRSHKMSVTVAPVFSHLIHVREHHCAEVRGHGISSCISPWSSCRRHRNAADQ